MSSSQPPPPLHESGMFIPHQTPNTIPCCTCGVPIAPNPANMCVRCLRSRVDITSHLPKHSIVSFCPECSSYLQPPRTWIPAAPESKQLLSLLLRRLPLRHLRLVDAQFVWTEPHSKRLKLRLLLQSESLHGAILQQPHVVEFVVNDHLCDNCNRAQANPDQWIANVQLRQHVSHRRTFLFLEQLILRHGAAARAIKIKEADRGIDFYFGNRSHAVKFVEFVNGVAPVKYRSDKQLVSHDVKSNVYNYKHTFSVEISPVCREDLICLPPKVANFYGNIGPIVLCTKVTNSIFLLDPITLRTAYVDGSRYWANPFKPLLTSRQLVEYIVLDIDVESAEVSVGGSRYCLAYAQVARMSDFGKNDNIFTVRTHLGHLLNPGDYALGYDLYAANSNDFEIEQHKGLELPEAILVKKSYEEKRSKRRRKSRAWKLKKLNMEVDTLKGKTDEDKRHSEYEQFMRDLEENPELRFNISLYPNKEYEPSEIASTVGGDDLPSVPLDELLADLDLSDEEDGEDNDGMHE